jgi:hypothetical protein
MQLTIKTYYGKDLLITFANGEEIFLLWGEYKIAKLVEDGDEWIEILYEDSDKTIFVGKGIAQDQDCLHEHNGSNSITIEILN